MLVCVRVCVCRLCVNRETVLNTCVSKVEAVWRKSSQISCIPSVSQVEFSRQAKVPQPTVRAPVKHLATSAEGTHRETRTQLILNVLTMLFCSINLTQLRWFSKQLLTGAVGRKAGPAGGWLFWVWLKGSRGPQGEGDGEAERDQDKFRKHFFYGPRCWW